MYAYVSLCFLIIIQYSLFIFDVARINVVVVVVSVVVIIIIFVVVVVVVVVDNYVIIIAVDCDDDDDDDDGAAFFSVFLFFFIFFLLLCYEILYEFQFVQNYYRGVILTFHQLLYCFLCHHHYSFLS